MSTSGAINYPMPALSKQAIDTNFKQATQGFTERWHKFAQDKNFDLFTHDFDEQLIIEKFKQMKQVRMELYYENPGAQPLRSNPDFERSQQLLAQGYYKAPHMIAFDYNASHQSYNSSNVTLNGHRFLALEGPQQPHHVNNFLFLLINYNVKKVVRLTNDIENGVFKAENYWRDNITKDPAGQETLTFKIAVEENDQPYNLPYYALNHWSDNTGTSPETILDLLTAVRANYQPGDIIAVHCSAGVGRTGTFIAAFLLLDEIDKQLQAGISKDKVTLSIEELVYKLSLQRAYLVGENEQYLTLHKLVKLYLSKSHT